MTVNPVRVAYIVVVSTERLKYKIKKCDMLIQTIPKLRRELGRVSNFNQSIN